MKRLLVIAAFVLLCRAVPAAAQDHVYETARGSGTVHNVLVTNSAVQLDVSTRTIGGVGSDGSGISGRFVIEVWNDSSTEDLFCAFDRNVSSTAGAAHYGRRVPPRQSWTIAITEAVKMWCISSATGARVNLTQLY